MNTIVIIRSHSNSNNSLAMPVPGFSEDLADSLFQGSAGRPAHSNPSKSEIVTALFTIHLGLDSKY